MEQRVIIKEEYKGTSVSKESCCCCKATCRSDSVTNQQRVVGHKHQRGEGNSGYIKVVNVLCTIMANVVQRLLDAKNEVTVVTVLYSLGSATNNSV